MKKKWLLSMVILMLAILSGCQYTQETKKEGATRIVEDARGKQSIPLHPKRIVDISGNSDILSLLGYSVIGTANSDAYDYTKLPSYLQDALQGAEIVGYSMQDTMDIEGIVKLKPDLIIISTVQEKMADQLEKIAPVVTLSLAQIDWREDVQQVAKLFGKEPEANKWLNAYDALAKKVGKQLRTQRGEDTTYLALLASQGQLFVFDAAGMGSLLYDDLGLKKPANLPKQENISLPVISQEGLASLDPDVLIILGEKQEVDSLKKQQVYRQMRSVKENNVIQLPASPFFNMGYSSLGRYQFLQNAITLLGNGKDA